MERRSELRFEVSEPITLTVLGDVETALPAVVRNVSGRGLRVSVGTAIPLDAAVRIEWNDTLLLGETCYCKKENGGFAVGIELEQALAGVSEITAQMAALAIGLSNESACPDTVKKAGS